MTHIAYSLGRPEAFKGRPSTSRRIRRQRGLTLIEAATVLAALSFVVADIMQLYTAADGSRKTTAALSELATIQQSVRSLYGGQASYTGLTTETMAQGSSLPSKMISNGSSIRNSFGGAVSIVATSTGGITDSSFEVQFTNVPKEPCVKILASDLGRGLFSVGTSTATRTTDSGTPPPFDPASASEACANASSNTIS